MKTVIPVLDTRRVSDPAYLVRYWSEMVFETGGFVSALMRANYQLAWVLPVDRAYALSVLVLHREEVEDFSARRNAEANCPPLPGLEPMAARSAATA